MIIKRKIENFLNVHTGEWRLLGIFFLLNFIVAVAGCIGLNIAESIFIKNYGTGRIPLIFLISYSCIVFFTFLFNYIRSHTSLYGYNKLIIFSFTFLLIINSVLLLFFPHIKINSGLLFILGYLSFYIIKTLLLNIAEFAYDIRQLKRLLPTILSGTIFGFAAGGFATGQLLDFITARGLGAAGLQSLMSESHIVMQALENHSENIYLIPVWTFLLAGSFLISRYILGQYAESRKKENKSEKIFHAIMNNFKNLKKSKLFLFLAIISFIVAFLVMYYDYVYMFIVDKYHGGNAEAIAKTFGEIRGYSTLLTFFILFIFTSFLIKIFGLTNILQILPLVFFGFFILLRYSFCYFFIIMGRYGYYIAKEAFHFPVFQPLFKALSNKVKTNAVPFINNVIFALGSIAAGILLLFTGTPRQINISNLDSNVNPMFEINFTPGSFIYLVIGLSLILLFITLKTKKKYIKELLNNIRETSPKQLDMLEEVKKMKGASAIKQMKQILNQNDKNLILFVIESMKNIDTNEADNDIINLLNRFEDSQIAAKVFDYFGNTFHRPLIDTADHIHHIKNNKTKIIFLNYLSNFVNNQNCSDSAININQLIHSFLNDQHTAVKIKASAILIEAGDSRYQQDSKNFIKEQFDKSNINQTIKLIDNISHNSNDYLIDLALKQQEKIINDNVPAASQQQYLRLLSNFNVLRAYETIIKIPLSHPQLKHPVLSLILSLRDKIKSKFISHTAINFLKESNDYGTTAFLIKVLLNNFYKTPQCEKILLKELLARPEAENLNHEISAYMPKFFTQPDEETNKQINSYLLAKINNIKRNMYYIDLFRRENINFSEVLESDLSRMIQRQINTLYNIIAYQYAAKNIEIALNGIKSNNGKLYATSLETVENILPRRICEPFFEIITAERETVLEQNREIQNSLNLKTLLDYLLELDSEWLNCYALYIANSLNIKNLKLPKIKNESPELYRELYNNYNSV
ncbi:MAG TPA: MFS transporter [Spirochaetota bacterium]|nr:MFS transporter [Spirochaetota bacterium]